MDDFSQEKWLELYQSALLEFKHALMAGRIMEARAEIVNRVELLEGMMPALHKVERQAIADALSGLRMLESEERKFQVEQQRQIASAALAKLESIAPTIERSKSDSM